MHRDIKSANVFLNKDGSVKLGDMNVSKVISEGLMVTQTGTPYYASPEVWWDKPYDEKSDIWSMGCVLYEMCALKPPFMGKDMEWLFKKVCMGHYELISDKYSNDLHNMVSWLLKVRPFDRPTCADILNMKEIKEKIQIQKEEGKGNLLGTIIVPKNLWDL